MSAFFTTNSVPEGVRSVFERSRVALTLADPAQPDMPLVGLTAKFSNMTGYDPDEALGRNCRFLQPEEGAGPVRTRMHKFLHDDALADAKFLLPNVKQDGTPFLNLLYMSKLVERGRLIYVLGSQFEVKPQAKSEAHFYEKSLVEDLGNLKDILGEHTMVMLGSFESLASSHSILARAGIGDFHGTD